ncbi:MAG: hypothetical protein Q8T08_20875, partial [Ignavibacteria bacterium]|nr:hypothetical protein [Ignavibacteria bacterium]
ARISFSVPALSDYGNLFLDIAIDENTPMIIQLLNLKEEVLSQYFLEGSQKLELKNMKPGKYKLKAIQDNNRNRRWDTGNLIDKLQAESIYYYTKELEVRPNWDLEEEWDLSNTEVVKEE